MIVIVLGFALVALAASIVVAYAAWLATARRRTWRTGDPACPDRQDCLSSTVLIVVPTFDEAALIERKLENLAALTYANHHTVIVDGGSTDGTLGRISRWLATRDGFTLIETDHRNKTAHLNEALETHPGAEWILVTDADAALAPDAIERLLEVADPQVGVVGASVRPDAAHALESLHWRATDWLRDREYDRGSAGIVAAPCYLVRRELLAALPADTLADDVHVACRAMAAGWRVGHAATTVLELRSPRTLPALLRHKFRKADAYLREIMRFAGQRMPAVFLWRAALLTIVPLLATLGGLALAPLVVAIVALLFAIPLLRPLARGVALAIVLIAVSAAAVLMYPFSRQVASFPKIYQLPDEAP